MTLASPFLLTTVQVGYCRTCGYETPLGRAGKPLRHYPLHIRKGPDGEAVRYAKVGAWCDGANEVAEPLTPALPRCAYEECGAEFEPSRMSQLLCRVPCQKREAKRRERHGGESNRAQQASGTGAA